MHKPSTLIRRQGPLSGRGFSLLELMIALVVVGILAGIAYPSYMGSVRKGRRAEAVQALNAAQQAQERFRANKASFASSITAAPSGDPGGLGLSDTSSTGLYALSVADVTASNYTLVATANSGTSQANDTSCIRMAVKVVAGNISYGSGGSAGALDYTDAARCWSR